MKNEMKMKNFPHAVERISCLKNAKEMDIAHKARSYVINDVYNLESPT